MNRRNLLAAAVMAALAGCSSQPAAGPVEPPEGPPPAGAKLVVLNLPGMT